MVYRGEHHLYLHGADQGDDARAARGISICAGGRLRGEGGRYKKPMPNRAMRRSFCRSGMVSLVTMGMGTAKTIKSVEMCSPTKAHAKAMGWQVPYRV